MNGVHNTERPKNMIFLVRPLRRNSNKVHLDADVSNSPPHVLHNHAVSIAFQLTRISVLDIFQRPKFARPAAVAQLSGHM